MKKASTKGAFFLADRRNPNNRNDVSIEDDYIELLNMTPVDTYEDIYSDSSQDPDAEESYGDIYIGSKKRFRGRVVEDEDIYEYEEESGSDEDDDDEYEYEEIPVAPRRVGGRYSTVDADKDEISDYDETHHRKRKHKKNPVIKIIALLLVVAVAVGVFAYSALSSVVGEFAQGSEIEHIAEVDSLVSASHVRNILLIGADKEKGGASRSDSMMIASINSKTGKVTVVSILRDTHVDVPGHRESKINAAHTWGGPNLLIQTIEQNFGIKIDDYATLNFEMFEALVDGIGGVEVEVSEGEASHMNSYFKLGTDGKPDKVEPGENVYLNGYQALCYARIRKLDSDFQRTERQQKIIGAILEKVKGDLNPAGIPKLMETAKSVAPYIETTLSEGDVLSLLVSMSSCVAKSGGDINSIMVSAQLPFEGTWWYSSEWDGSSISIDLEANKAQLYTILYEQAPQEEATQTQE